MTIAYPDLCDTIVTDTGVYAPQHDSRLLIDALAQTGLAPGRHVLDFCTGSGVVAVAAAQLGAATVTAFDVCPRAVQCSQANVDAAGVNVDVRLGSLADVLQDGPFDVVVSNPPYVPVGPDAHFETIPADVGPSWAWDAGPDGRLVLDPLCASARDLLIDGGTMLLVQSELPGVEQSIAALHSVGLDAEILLYQLVPFGPVLSARARWLESTGRLPVGRREEELVVIRADKQP
jgi:release factor glutamine methyltransferase